MSYLKRILIAIDQLGNAAANGNPDETVSSRVGKNAIAGKWWALVAEKVINWTAWHVFHDPDHCRRAIEYDEIG